MQTIKEILTYPNGTPIESFQAQIGAVYEYREQASKFNKTGKCTVQAVVLKDGSGNSIRASFWDHPDLTDHKGREYIFSGGGKKGITVKHGEYQGKPTIELSVSRAGTLQNIVVHNTANPSPAGAPNPGTPASSIPQSPAVAAVAVHGAKVGMAVNNAVLLVTALGGEYIAPDKVMGHIKSRAIDIIRLSNDLESGRLSVAEPLADQKAANVVDKKGNPAPDEDVPY